LNIFILEPFWDDLVFPSRPLGQFSATTSADG